MSNDLHRNIAVVADAHEHRVDELSETIARRIRGEVPAIRRFDSAELQTTLRAAAATSLATELHHMRNGRALPTSCPPDAAESARLAAVARIPPTVVLQTHRIGHSVVWDAFVEETESLPVESVLRRELLDAGSRFLFGYADSLARFVEAEYAREHSLLQPGSERDRARTVLDLLEGRSHTANGLPYDLDAIHLGVIADGDAGSEALRELAKLLDRRLLTISVSGHGIWAWLGGHRPLGSKEWRELSTFRVDGASLATGEEAAGLDGFRTSHRQALDAHGVRLRCGSHFSRYRDVALEALALRDEEAARRVVDLELAPLGSGDRAVVLKATIRTYFACSQNAAATAAALGVHEQTVAQRLRAAEEQIGAPVNARRAELEVALRVEALLGRPTDSVDRST